MVTLSYVNIFARNMDRLAAFYSKLFDFEEIAESRTEYYRGFRCGGASLGFSTSKAYELLALRPPTGTGETNLITFDASSAAELRKLYQAAIDGGAMSLKEPFETYYGWYQAMLRDPEGNAFRLSYPGKA